MALICEKSADFLFEKSVLIHTKRFLTPIFMSGAVGGRRGPSGAVGGRRGPSGAVGEKNRLMVIRLNPS